VLGAAYRTTVQVLGGIASTRIYGLSSQPAQPPRAADVIEEKPE